jgi:hypothetical protein
MVIIMILKTATIRVYKYDILPNEWIKKDSIFNFYTSFNELSNVIYIHIYIYIYIYVISEEPSKITGYSFPFELSIEL